MQTFQDIFSYFFAWLKLWNSVIHDKNFYYFNPFFSHLFTLREGWKREGEDFFERITSPSSLIFAKFVKIHSSGVFRFPALANISSCEKPQSSADKRLC